MLVPLNKCLHELFLSDSWCCHFISFLVFQIYSKHNWSTIDPRRLIPIVVNRSIVFLLFSILFSVSYCATVSCTTTKGKHQIHVSQQIWAQNPTSARYAMLQNSCMHCERCLVYFLSVVMHRIAAMWHFVRSNEEIQVQNALCLVDFCLFLKLRFGMCIILMTARLESAIRLAHASKQCTFHISPFGCECVCEGIFKFCCCFFFSSISWKLLFAWKMKETK